MRVWWRTYKRTERHVLLMVLICTAIWTLFMFALAHGDENWNTCEEAYKFCKLRPYHRECSLWTKHGEDLSVHSFPAPAANPNYLTPFCAENQWHMSCGAWGKTPDPVVKRCPMPGKYQYE